MRHAPELQELPAGDKCVVRTCVETSKAPRSTFLSASRGSKQFCWVGYFYGAPRAGKVASDGRSRRGGTIRITLPGVNGQDKVFQLLFKKRIFAEIFKKGSNNTVFFKITHGSFAFSGDSFVGQEK